MLIFYNINPMIQKTKNSEESKEVEKDNAIVLEGN